MVLSFNGITFSQIDSIKVTSNGLTTCTIKTNLPSTVEYERTLKWINETYKNPERVIVGNKINEYLIISGYSNNAFSQMNMGMYCAFSLTYNIDILIKDSCVVFKFIPNEYRSVSVSNSPSNRLDIKSWFKSDGTYRKLATTSKSTLEETINSLLFSYYYKLNDNSLTSDEALLELKKCKDKLDLGIISQSEYDKVKLELIKFIK